MNARLIIFLVIVCLLAVLLVQNQGVVTAPATYRIFFWTVNAAPVVLIPILVLTGFVAGLVFGLSGRRKRKPTALPPVKPAAPAKPAEPARDTRERS